MKLKSILQKGDIFKKISNDNFFSGFIFLLLSSIFSAGVGFLFWLFAAKLFSEYDVGIATSIISLLSLIILFSRFGFDYSIIRFFPEKKRKEIFGTSLLITTTGAIVIFFIVLVIENQNFWPSTIPNIDNFRLSLLFLSLLVLLSFQEIITYSFNAIRATNLTFLQNIILGSRLFFLFPLAILGATGIWLAFGLSYLISVIISLMLLKRIGYFPIFSIDTQFLRDSVHYSLGNYFSNFFRVAPNFILPLMVLTILGAEATALFYIAFVISSLLTLVPDAIGTSLFIEGSQGIDFQILIKKALLTIYSILIPLFFIIVIWGKAILLLFGDSYLGSYNVLVLLSLSSFFIAIISIYFSIKRIQKRIKELIYISFLSFIFVILFNFVFLDIMGFDGIGYASLLTNFLIVLCIFLLEPTFRKFFLMKINFLTSPLN